MKKALIFLLKVLLYLALAIGSAYVVHELYLSASSMQFCVAFLGGSVATLMLQDIMRLFTSLDANNKFKTIKNEKGKGGENK